MTERGGSRSGRRFTDGIDAIETIVGRGMRVEGTLEGSGSLELWGVFSGKISIGGLLWIREGGRLTGDASAASVIVEGVVEGDVVALDKVELRATGDVRGDIASKALAMAEGCRLDGTVRMGSIDRPPQQVTFKEKRQPPLGR